MSNDECMNFILFEPWNGGDKTTSKCKKIIAVKAATYADAEP